MKREKHTRDFNPLPRSELRRLSRKKARRESGVYLLEGASAVRDALSAGAKILQVVYDKRASSRQPDRTALGQVGNAGIPLEEIPEAELARISGLSTPPPVLAVVRAPEPPLPKNPPVPGVTLVLDRVNDPGNVGTLLRAAAFYGVREVWLSSGTADLYNPKTLRAAMSAHLHLDICRNLDLVTWLTRAQESGAEVLAAVAGVGETPSFIGGKERPSLLVLGSEAHGIAPELLHLTTSRIGIPRTGPVDSLNVAMAGTVLLDRLLRP